MKWLFSILVLFLLTNVANSDMVVAASAPIITDMPLPPGTTAELLVKSDTSVLPKAITDALAKLTMDMQQLSAAAIDMTTARASLALATKKADDATQANKDLQQTVADDQIALTNAIKDAYTPVVPPVIPPVVPPVPGHVVELVVVSTAFTKDDVTNCTPCKKLYPILDKLEALGAKIKRVKDGTADAATWAIQATPTIIMTVDGKETRRVEGFLILEHLQGWLDDTKKWADENLKLEPKTVVPWNTIQVPKAK